MDNRTYGTEVSGTSVKDSLIKSQSIELSGNLFDDILGGGANAANLSYSRGDLGGFGVLPSMLGDYSIYNYSLSRQQAFNEKLSLFLIDKRTVYGRALLGSRARRLFG